MANHLQRQIQQHVQHGIQMINNGNDLKLYLKTHICKIGTEDLSTRSKYIPMIFLLKKRRNVI